MLACTMQMHLSEARKRRETKTKTYKKLTKEKSAIKRGNKPQAPLASEQKCPAQAAWLECLRSASLKVYKSHLYGPSHSCLAGSGIGCLCVWFWSVGQDSLQC